jgi:hypothetical protein
MGESDAREPRKVVKDQKAIQNEVKRADRHKCDGEGGAAHLGAREYPVPPLPKGRFMPPPGPDGVAQRWWRRCPEDGRQPECQPGLRHGTPRRRRQRCPCRTEGEHLPAAHSHH